MDVLQYPQAWRNARPTGTHCAGAVQRSRDGVGVTHVGRVQRQARGGGVLLGREMVSRTGSANGTKGAMNVPGGMNSSAGR